MEFVAELLEREAAMLIALDSSEAGRAGWPARDWTEAAPIKNQMCTCDVAYCNLKWPAFLGTC